jgi:hypothetical protein
MKNESPSTVPISKHFSPSERQQILDRLLSSLRGDQRVQGVLTVGSGSEGFADIYSDIDLCVVIAQGEDVYSTFESWREKLEQLLPIFYCGKSIRGVNSYLWVVLLENFLEIDVGFRSFEDLEARRGRWRTEFDHSGKIEGKMQTSWASRSGPGFEEVYDRCVKWIWHNVIHANVAVQRGQMWRALYEIERIRHQTVELRGKREGLETKRFRHIDRLPREYLLEIERTLVRELEPAEMMRALREATASFFVEAKHWDTMLNREWAARFERKLTDYLESFE